MPPPEIPEGLQKFFDFLETLPGRRESEPTEPAPTSEQLKDLARENQRLRGEAQKAPFAERSSIVTYLQRWAGEANKVGQHVLASELGALAEAIRDGDHLLDHPLKMPQDMIGDVERDQMQEIGVPTNEELAEQAKGVDTHTVIMGWLARHARPTGAGSTWLNWAADNFLADPEIRAHLRPVTEPVTEPRARTVALEDIEEAERSVERERVVAHLERLAANSRYFDVGVLLREVAGEIAHKEHWTEVS